MENILGLFLFLEKGGDDMYSMKINQNIDALMIGKRICEVRKSKNIKAIDVAEILNISKNQYSRIENGHALCTTENLFLIAQYLNVSTDYLLYGKAKTNVILEIEALLKYKSEEELKMAKRVLEAIFIQS